MLEESTSLAKWSSLELLTEEDTETTARVPLETRGIVIRITAIKICHYVLKQTIIIQLQYQKKKELITICLYAID